MKNQFVGRNKERKILEGALQSNEAEMVAVIGRRRVGKTFLIQTIFKKNIIFELTGTQDASASEQLENFAEVMTELINPKFPIKRPESWQEAFRILKSYLKDQLNNKEKVVLFFDELPWLATGRGGFLRAYSYFWNSWACHQNLLIAICGSAASWMIKNVVNNTGGLHNRITQRIYLQPFDLVETELFFKSRKIEFNRYEIVQIFMVTGGIPHYLKEIHPGKSAAQNINRICFSENGLLRAEFSALYPALFSNPEIPIKVVRILAQTHAGMTRQKILTALKIKSGENITKVLTELSQSGFISNYRPFGKKNRNTLYRLTDEYSLFYLKFIEPADKTGDNTWQLLSQTQSYKIWAGYAFENICLKHILPIKKALGIAGVYSISSSFYKKGTAKEPGAQIDLVIDRNDNVVTLVEIKFSSKPYTISKNYAENMRNKMSIFQEVSKTRKQIFWVMVTTFGVKANSHSLGLIGESLTLDDLFII